MDSFQKSGNATRFQRMGLPGSYLWGEPIETQNAPLLPSKPQQRLKTSMSPWQIWPLSHKSTIGKAYPENGLDLMRYDKKASGMPTTYSINTILGLCLSHPTYGFLRCFMRLKKKWDMGHMGKWCCHMLSYCRQVNLKLPSEQLHIHYRMVSKCCPWNRDISCHQPSSAPSLGPQLAQVNKAISAIEKICHFWLGWSYLQSKLYIVIPEST